jgi:hypothetical protein
MKTLLSRKFIFAILAVLLGFGLVLTKYLDANQWLNFVQVIGGIYVIGNVVSHGLDK